MTKSLQTTALEHLGAKLREQVLEVATLRLALDIQSARLALMQAEHDVPQLGSKLPQTFGALVTHTPYPHRSPRSPHAYRR